MKIQDVMSSDVHVIDSTATVKEAAVMMRKRDIGSIPISREGVLVGMVTDRDIVLRVVADGQDCETLVADAMSDGVKYCFEDETVDEVARRMADLAIRRLPVLDRDIAWSASCPSPISPAPMTPAPLASFCRASLSRIESAQYRHVSNVTCIRRRYRRCHFKEADDENSNPLFGNRCSTAVFRRGAAFAIIGAHRSIGRGDG